MASAPPFVPGQQMHPRAPANATVFALASEDTESATTITGGGTNSKQQRASSADAKGLQSSAVQNPAAPPQPSLADRKPPSGARLARQLWL